MTKRKDPPIKRMFPLDDEDEGMANGRNKNLNEINAYVIPKLNEIGIDAAPIVGGVEVRTNFPIWEYELWSSLGMRFVKGGSGNIHEIFSIQNPKKRIRAQILVAKDSSLRNVHRKAKFELPASIVNSTTEEYRIEHTLHLLKPTNLYLFILIRPSLFILLKYADLPKEAYKLRDRKKGRGNRMQIDTNYLLRTFIPLSDLEKILKSILK